MLGPPPEWYRSAAYRARVVRDPREVLIEFGLNISAETTIRVYDSTADLRYMVMPLCPPGVEDMPVTHLQTIITRDSMIGVGLPKLP
jgi:nitrile hydratase